KTYQQAWQKINQNKIVAQQIDIEQPISLAIFACIPSTNTQLWESIARGTLCPTAAIALEQTAGKGQWGHSWISARGGLYLSVGLDLDLAIDNYRMDLPLQKGLSSSAAICVLVARAFNQLYQLGLSVAEEMELAYWGERTTPSQCGRLDQACAYGKQPILMTFDGDRCTTQPLTVGKDLYLIIVDLAGVKNTQKILAQLNRCYPLAQNPLAVQVQKYLGEINQTLVKQAVIALQQGNGEKIGALMNQAQAEFDRYVIPACPEQLKAPMLHQLLDYPSLKPYLYGGKGVGSQGDGTVQLIAQDRSSQSEAIALIKRDFPQMQCYKLDISQQIN
ncbi:MAG: hypothetical protein RLZZ69_501, partial [Cyanobacteriota bacterium]